jgi:FeS assembly SUF system protein
MKQIANADMVKNAVGAEEYDSLQEPPKVKATRDHPLWPLVRKALMSVYDPEIPTNIYELGLILNVELKDAEDANVTDCHVDMTLTSPGCPVAQEMPGMVQSAIMPIDGIGEVTVEIIWDPAWDPSFMSETAKMELNMF